MTGLKSWTLYPSMKPTCNLEEVLDLRSLPLKSQAEIVITRFNEPLEWTRGIEDICTVYNKGQPFESKAHVINVPNHGLGCETILRHICERYHTLADVTLFCQATLCDRPDQPMYPLTQYLKCPIDSVFGNKEELCDVPKSRYLFRNGVHPSVGNKNFGEWRKKVLKYKPAYESWVKGDWISVGAQRVRKRPLEFYQNLYALCEFQRGILVEECWFLERSFYTIFS